MTLFRRKRQAVFQRQHEGRQFGHKFFPRVASGAERVGQVTVESAFMARPVPHFVENRRIIFTVIGEGALDQHMDDVAIRVIHRLTRRHFRIMDSQQFGKCR